MISALGMVVLVIAAWALIAAGSSLLVGLALPVLDRWLDRRQAHVRVRMLLCVGWWPLALASIVALAALSPAFGWIADHCGATGDPHSHPHLCGHVLQSAPALPLWVVAGCALARLLAAGLRATRLMWLARQLRRTLREHGSRWRLGKLLVLDWDTPRAFALGHVRPQLLVTRALLESTPRPHRRAVIAHEIAHVRSRDGLWRLLSSIALSAHLPGLAGALDRRLARAQEMAADAAAAQATGSRTTLAEALVHLARYRDPLWMPLAQAFAVTEVELRVRELLRPAPTLNNPTRGGLLLWATLVLTAVAVAADPIHHGIELMLGVLSRP